MTPQDVDAYFYSDVGPVWGELRGGLWHSTGSHLFRRILDAGEIQPAPPLAPSEFRWAAAQGTTYTRSVGAVSLFDFAEADWTWLLDENISKAMPRNCWSQFLRARSPQAPMDAWISTVWLSIDRTNISGFMHWKDVEADWRAGGTARKWMPRIEACHKGALPMSACDRAVIVCAVEPKEFLSLQMHSFDLRELERVEADWRKQFAERYESRALPIDERQRLWLSKLAAQPGPHKPNPELEERMRDANRRLKEYRAKKRSDAEDE